MCALHPHDLRLRSASASGSLLPTTISADDGSVMAGQAVTAYARTHAISLRAIASRARLPHPYCELLVDGERELVEPDEIRAIAEAIETPAARLFEYRVAMVLQALTHRPERLHATFLRTVSSVELGSLGETELSDEPLGPTVARLLEQAELTRRELTDGSDLTPLALGRALGGRWHVEITTLESIAQSLGVAPELFLEYRVELVREWLHRNPQELDLLFGGLDWEPRLEQQRTWTPRPLPHPLECPPRALLESMLEIVSHEGPVMGARVNQLRLEAAGLDESPELRTRLDDVSAAAAQAGLLIADPAWPGRGQQLQKILRLPTQPACRQRVLGARAFRHVPPSELCKTITDTPEWKLRQSMPRLQKAILRTYGISRMSRADVEHMNRCIARARQGDES